MKRTLSIIVALLLIFSLVGCGKTGREIVQVTLSTEDSEVILAAAGITLPDVEETVAAGTTIKWLSHFDPYHNYSEEEVVNTGFWTFQEKYGCDVEWIECEYNALNDTLANLILSGNSPDFFAGGITSFPDKALRRMFQPVDTYIDYDDPLWSGMKEYAYNYMSINGRPYYICTDNTFNNVCAYNRRVMEECGFDDPAELYYNDEWTWDVFYDMCMEFSDPDEDRYALDGWEFYYGLMHSCGTSVVVYNTETHHYESNVDDPRLERAANLLYDLAKNECVYPWWANGWNIRNGIEGAGIKEGLQLFYIRGTWAFTGPVEEVSQVWGDVTQNELMFVPLPRDPNGNGRYYTESAPSGFHIVKGAANPEGVALLAACERFKIIDPTVISIDRKNLEEVYLWTPEMLAMYDTCYDLALSVENVIAVYGTGLGDDVYQVVNKFETNGHEQNASTWAQLKEKYSDKLSYLLDELNKQLDEFTPTES